MAIADLAASSPGRRIAVIDVLRGVAIVGMVIYHFSWDLAYFGLTTADVDGGRWWVLLARTTASTFLLLVGIGLVLATRHGLNLQRFLRRVALIVLGAAAVSVATYVIDPSTFVFFGILQLIAAASLLAVPFLALPVWLTAVVGVAIVLLGNFFFSSIFDAPWLVWIGMAPEVPATVDYVPIFPWLGVVLLGIVAGNLLFSTGLEARIAGWRPADPVTRSLSLAGQWSLVIYLVHQVILFGGVWAVATVLAPAPALTEAPPPSGPAGASVATESLQTYMNECLASCGAQGKDVARCTPYCACMFAGLSGDQPAVDAG